MAIAFGSLLLRRGTVCSVFTVCFCLLSAAAGLLAGCSGGGSGARAMGESCDHSSACASGVCLDGVCRQLCNQAEECPQTLGCRSGVCQACTAADECAGQGWCDSTGTCRSDCTRDIDCKEQGYCNSAGTCVAGLAYMESCDRDRACADDNCLAGTCCPLGCATACSGAVCLFADGAACNSDAECESGVCVDRTCCAGSCDAPCQTCYGAVPGICEPMARGVDDACPTVCRDGECLGARGERCTGAEQCESDFCADDFCCDAPCDGECRSCGQTGREGACTAVVATEWETCSYGLDGARACDASGACSAPHVVLDINGLDGARDFVALTSGAIVFSANAAGKGRELWVYDPARKAAHLLQDIRIGPAGSGISYLQSSPGAGAGALFIADNDANGRELWRTDGVTAGIIELNPGPNGSVLEGLAARDGSGSLLVGKSVWQWQDAGLQMSKLVDEAATFQDGKVVISAGPRTYFVSDTRSAARELGWIDRSAYPPAVKRLDMFAGRGSADPTHVAVTYPLLYFSARTSDVSFEAHQLYATNWMTGSDPVRVTGTCTGCGAFSTEDGEVQLAGMTLFFTGHLTGPSETAKLWAVDFGTANTAKEVPHPGTSSSVAPRLLTSAFDVLYFATDEGLWSTPTAYASVSATLEVPLVGGSGISLIYPAGEFIYFIADNGTHGAELWRTSVSVGSPRFLDLAEGSTSSDIHILERLSNNDVYFVATNETEGQALYYCGEDTFEMRDACRVLDPLPGPDSSLAFEPGERTNAIVDGDTLVFAALAERGGPYHLWRVGVDRVLRDLAVIDHGLASSNPAGYRDGFAPGEVLFAADDGIHGVELWTTDGTPANTRLVRDVYPGSGSGAPSAMTRLGTALLLSLCTPGDGCELWRWDGAAGGPTLLKNIDTTPMVGSSPHDLTPFAGKVVFSAGGELWVTDGTANGTVLLKDINPSGASSPERLSVVGGTLYFFADDGTNGKELWMSDGTASGTVIVADTGTISEGALVRDLAPCGDRLCFTGADTDAGTELWATNCKPGQACPVCRTAVDCPDGCPATGACLLGDLRPGAAIVAPAPHTLYGTVGGLLFFRAYLDGSSPIYVTDGTPPGTRLFSDVDATPPPDILPPFVLAGRQAYFLASDHELWATDGKDAWPVWSGLAIDAQVPFVAYRNRLYFSALAEDAASGAKELFVTDGNASAAYPACDDRMLCLNPKGLGVARDRLWFSAETPVGRELLVFP